MLALGGRRLFGAGLGEHPGVLAGPPGLLGAQEIDQPTGTDGDQPRHGVLRPPLVGPLARRVEQRLLDRVLGRVEVPVTTDQRSEDLRRALAQQVLVIGASH